ncbi:hypothetical protein DENSPDRAFT_580746 [Dentipellis sp. KUC8613]|nr:hypothetical protein DENSPDRAFT_580746 [Dentipellis sp. KUC8613]
MLASTTPSELLACADSGFIRTDMDMSWGALGVKNRPPRQERQTATPWRIAMSTSSVCQRSRMFGWSALNPPLGVGQGRESEVRARCSSGWARPGCDTVSRTASGFARSGKRPTRPMSLPVTSSCYMEG